jgi:hypothetical protein
LSYALTWSAGVPLVQRSHRQMKHQLAASTACFVATAPPGGV